ncbi:MAG: TetR/AcrR family transcriptional regulator [Rhizomicrobium sp.]
MRDAGASPDWRTETDIMAARKSVKQTSRSRLLKAAEDLMRESGYAAVTSRRVAAKAGLKPQLVHYYFHTMDDLFLALYRQLATGIIERQKTILSANKPLSEMWKLTADARGVLLNYEFVALANHRKVIRKEIAEFGNRFRRSQIEIMGHILAKNGVKGFPWTPDFAAVLLNSLARSLSVESEVGMTEGHAEALRTIEHFIEQFDRQVSEVTIYNDASP